MTAADMPELVPCPRCKGAPAVDVWPLSAYGATEVDAWCCCDCRVSIEMPGLHPDRAERAARLAWNASVKGGCG